MRDEFCEHWELRPKPRGCSQTWKPASNKEKQGFAIFEAGVRFSKNWLNEGGVRKTAHEAKHIKESSARRHNQNTSIKRIETLRDAYYAYDPETVTIRTPL